MEALRDILRTFRPVGGETLRVAGSGAEPFAAVDPRALRVEAEAGSSAHLVVLHTKADAASLTVALGEGAQLELTHLFAAEAFAEVSVRQSARSRCRVTTVQLTGANASYRIDLDGAEAENSAGPSWLRTGSIAS